MRGASKYTLFRKLEGRMMLDPALHVRVAVQVAEKARRVMLREIRYVAVYLLMSVTRTRVT